MSEREKLVSSYNKEFMSIITLAENHFAADRTVIESIKRLKDRLVIAKGANYEILITFLGPYILKYKSIIDNKNFDEFTEEKLSAEIAKLDKKDIVVDVFHYFRMAKRMHDDIDIDERDVIFGKMKNLLVFYLEFCIKFRE